VKRNKRNHLLPGEDLVEEGLSDLAGRRVTDLSLLVLIGGPRLRRLGIAVPLVSARKPFEHQLYERLDRRLGAAAHSYYNSLIRRLVSYERALERELSRSAEQGRSGTAARNRIRCQSTGERAAAGTAALRTTVARARGRSHRNVSS
jgi:hypothetical protein